MPKVLQINSTVNKGSAGRIAEQIGVIAQENGWESFIAYGRNSNKSSSKNYRIGNTLDVLLHGAKSYLTDKHGLGSSAATKDLLKYIDNINPNLIHLHGIHGYYINYEILFEYLAMKQIPVVWTMHDFWAITGHCSYFSDIECNKWQSTCNNCPKKTNYPKSLILDKSFENFTLKKDLFNRVQKLVIVPVSYWVDSLFSKSFLSAYERRVILNGVDTEKFRPIEENNIKKKFGIEDKFMLLGVATSWGVRKGWIDFMKLSSELSDDYKIVMVGLTQRQKSMIPANIIGVTRTENIDELAKYYSAADVVLNLSSQETFGMTTVEGYSCGTPSIVYNCTASPELVSNNTGFIVEKGNIKDLIVKINVIKNLGKSYYANECRIRALTHYDKSKRFLEYINLYDDLIK